MQYTITKIITSYLLRSVVAYLILDHILAIFKTNGWHYLDQPKLPNCFILTLYNFFRTVCEEIQCGPKLKWHKCYVCFAHERKDLVHTRVTHTHMKPVWFVYRVEGILLLLQNYILAGVKICSARTLHTCWLYTCLTILQVLFTLAETAASSEDLSPV